MYSPFFWSYFTNIIPGPVFGGQVNGTCGAVTSSVLAIGLALGIPREGQNDSLLRSACATVRNTILDKYYREYRSILCKDVQRKFFGKA